ncbi:ribosomal protein L4 [Aureobasidium pullulans]|nr:ribosomal protein L4 [Aureobasidium pullulans]THV91911.1 ribosomal protein L4 [Aureobasidium pullulans]THW19115.1 ribosomal protein L4 [Aureobasidium pullulans]THW25167.1 ribosomal protein L4 [Aureobasidium pullulans]THX98310.1 ribosomal protein L4 [Aureobasidium pullulans]
MATRRAVINCARWRSAPSVFARGLATESLPASTPDAPAATIAQSYNDATLSSIATAPVLNDQFTPPPPTPASAISRLSERPANPFLSTATCTLHDFPSVEPKTFTTYPSTHLLLPLRRDILHRAIVFEGDATRQGTANTKYRSEVHGSNRKVRPQKGTGRARLGDKKSPMLRGGGVAFGPKPRDFSTDLPSKIYDLAWRTALSYRYKKGELILLDTAAEIEVEGPGAARWLKELLRWNKWGNTNGGTLIVTAEKREKLFTALQQPGMDKEARALTVDKVDVKDLLEGGRVVIEKKALDKMFQQHSSDLSSRVKIVA